LPTAPACQHVSIVSSWYRLENKDLSLKRLVYVEGLIIANNKAVHNGRTIARLNRTSQTKSPIRLVAEWGFFLNLFER